MRTPRDVPPEPLDRSPESADQASDLVTVAIPARDEERFIAACLDSVLAQGHENLQVIVADGQSQDGTAAIVRSYADRDPRVQLLQVGHSTIPKALNLILNASLGKWLVRVDAHSTIPPDYVERAVKHLRTGRWGGVGGRKDGVGTTPAGMAIAAALGSPFGVGNSLYHYGSRPQIVDHVPFGAYPTELVRHLGGWDERLHANEDFEFDYRIRRAGHRLLFDPELSIAWRCRENIPDFFRQYRRYGRAKPHVLLLHPDSIKLRHLAAPMVPLFLAAAVALGFRWPKLSALAVSPYGLGMVMATVAAGRKVSDRRARVRIPAAFLAMHVGWGLGFWEAATAMMKSHVIDGPHRRTPS
jgi:succinoglycan biosynthesis protein ExoA